MVALFGCSGKPDPTSPKPDVQAVTVVWTFEAVERGAIVSTPLVTADRVYAAAVHDVGLQPAGAVYCLDRATGKKLWRFDDDGAMLHTYSTPCLADGRLYVGEGMHANRLCKLYCLNAATGEKLWTAEASDHIESSPCVADGRVYFGAGDDGLYCLDAKKGQRVWHFQRKLHVDASPAVADGLVFAGSGTSRAYTTTEVFCLDAGTGEVRWERPTELPVWGSPTVANGRVFFGLGNGRLVRSAQPPEKPAGAVLCVDWRTGRTCWSHRVADAVLSQPVVHEKRVYFGARDGVCHCLDEADGKPVWEQPVGSPVVTRTAVTGIPARGRVYVVASAGQVACFDAFDGTPLWTFDVAKAAKMQAQLFSSPVVWPHESVFHDIYFGAELKNPVSSAAVVFCLSD